MNKSYILEPKVTGKGGKKKKNPHCSLWIASSLWQEPELFLTGSKYPHFAIRTWGPEYPRLRECFLSLLNYTMVKADY